MARLQDLERRLQFDPAPFVFAQLADEYCRAGLHNEAIACCRTLLGRHPTYVTARVVLGRALAALDRDEEAATELEQVLAAAPDHLAAAKDLASVYERLRRPADALRCYRLALGLAHDDQDLQAAIERLSVTAWETPPVQVERVEPDRVPLTDLDGVLARLGHPNQPVPPLVETLLTEPERLLADSASEEARNAPVDPADVGTGRPEPLAALERALRGELNLEHRSVPADAEWQVLDQLQRWLAVVTHERAHGSTT